MILEKDAQFLEERDRFHLRMHCEDCLLFDAKSACAEGYPSDRHRRATAHDAAAPLVFCKHFELV